MFQLLLIQCSGAKAEDNILLEGPALRFAAPSQKHWSKPTRVMAMEPLHHGDEVQQSQSHLKLLTRLILCGNDLDQVIFNFFLNVIANHSHLHYDPRIVFTDLIHKGTKECDSRINQGK